MKELKFENQCLNITIQQMKKGEVNMLKEINSFPSFSYHLVMIIITCCKSPEFRENFGKTRGLLIWNILQLFHYK
jgi:hypothetical protein